MLRSLPLHTLVSCTLQLLVFFTGQSRPHAVHKGSSDVDRTDSQQVLFLQAVKTGILSSLGLDKEPTPNQKASEEELWKMFQLYKETLRLLRGNSSHERRGTSPPTISTVLFPATVELKKVPERGQSHSDHIQWYRAVFQQNPNIQTELTLARAELKISRQVLDKLTSAQPEGRPEIQVKVNRMESAAWTDINSPFTVNASSTQGASWDISPDVEEWLRTGGNRALFVDVGIAVAKGDILGENPTISLELNFRTRSRTRVTRSNKEDDCDERGWCCRKSVTVSFRDIGWSDWVIAPAEYIMHFCDGTCPHNYKPASMHTQVKSRLHQITKGGTPRPCCVPSAYEPMVLMHYDSRGTLKLTPFDDLIVSKCHCV